MGTRLMLTVCDADDASLTVPGLDAGTAAVAIARSWARAGRDVLLVDADAHGSGLSQRIGAATRLALDPAQRGLPSLIASRASLSAESVAQHCWLLPTSGGGSLHLLGAPTHPYGAHQAAAWLADRARKLAELAERWAVIVSMPGAAAPSYVRLSRVASQGLALAVAPGTTPPCGLRAVLAAFGPRFAPDPEIRLLIAEADAAAPLRLAADSLTTGMSAPLIGGVKRARPAVLLGARPGPRGRVLLKAVDGVAARLAAMADHADEQAALGAGANGLASTQCAAATAEAATVNRAPGRSPAGAAT